MHIKDEQVRRITLEDVYDGVPARGACDVRLSRSPDDVLGPQVPDHLTRTTRSSNVFES